MTELLIHDSVEQLLPAAALEILEGDELLRVTAHVRECAECTRQLGSYRMVLGGLASTLPRRPLESERFVRLRARLLTRVGSHPSVQPDLLAQVRRHSTGFFKSWVGWAVAAGLAGVLLIHHAVHRPLAYGWLLAGILTLVLLALGVYVRHLRRRLSTLEARGGNSDLA